MNDSDAALSMKLFSRGDSKREWIIGQRTETAPTVPDLVLASAGTLNVTKGDALYGRYWGAVEHVPRR